MKELVYPRLLLPRVERLADKVAFVDVTSHGVRYEGTFANHIDRLLRLGNAMRSELGVEPGDRFAVLATNGHEYVELFHAAMFGAGIINPLNIRFTPAELAYVLADSGTRVVFTDPVFATLLDRACSEAGAKIEKLVIIGGKAGDGITGRDGDTLSYEELLGGGEPAMPPEPDEEDAAVLMYTGGTTGLPKGALLQQRAEVLNVYHVLFEIGLREERRFLFQSPMFHAAVVAGVLGIPASRRDLGHDPTVRPGTGAARHRGTGDRHHDGGPRHVVDARASRGFLGRTSAIAAPAGLRGSSNVAGPARPVARDAARH